MILLTLKLKKALSTFKLKGVFFNICYTHLFLFQFQPWNEVTFSFAEGFLAGSVNKVRNQKFTNGPIRRTPYGISIGFVDGFKNFQGYMDYVTIYKCGRANVYNKY